MKKIHARQLIQKKIFMLWPKKIHTRNLTTTKNFCDSKIPLLPHPLITFLMVRPLKVPVMWATCKANRHAIGRRIESHWTGIELRKSDLIFLHFPSKTRRKRGRLQNAVQTFYGSCSPVFVVFVVCTLSYCRFASCFADSLRRFRMEWCGVSWFRNPQINSTNMDKFAFWRRNIG